MGWIPYEEYDEAEGRDLPPFEDRLTEDSTDEGDEEDV